MGHTRDRPVTLLWQLDGRTTLNSIPPLRKASRPREKHRSIADTDGELVGTIDACSRERTARLDQPRYRADDEKQTQYRHACAIANNTQAQLSLPTTGVHCDRHSQTRLARQDTGSGFSAFYGHTFALISASTFPGSGPSEQPNPPAPTSMVRTFLNFVHV
jgi:hypothetical protein